MPRLYVTGAAVTHFKQLLANRNEWRGKQGKTEENPTQFLERLMDFWETA